MPIPAEQDHADCERPLIQVSGCIRYSGWMVNMKTKPSRVPSSKSITKARKRATNRRTKRDVISQTLAFSMALAPRQMAAIVISIATAWKMMTWPGAWRKLFQTSMVSTPSASPPRMAAWK